jgi:hypothetical protein
MLNDLLTIERGLIANGIDFAGRHPDIKNIAKGWALCVRLAEGGRVSSVERIAEAGSGAVWTLRDGQHNGFPGLKTAAGLLALDAFAREEHDRAWNSGKSPSGRRDELLRLLSRHAVDPEQVRRWPPAGHRKRIRERLEALRSLADDPVSASVPAVFERFLAALDASPSFLEQLTGALADRVRNSDDDWLDPVRAALIGPIVLAVDVKDMEFERDAGDVRQIEAVSRALSNPPSTGNEQINGEAVCALTGKATKLHAGNFPQPNLPGLGQTYIYSRNRDIPSLTRYGRTADASFSVDADLVRRLAGAVTELTREDRKGKTWRLIPAESGDKPDLLVVSFPSPDTVGDVDALADDEDGDGRAVTGVSRLLELGRRVIEHSEGRDTPGHPADMQVLVLRTVDPANRQAIYDRRIGAREFFNAAKYWERATANTPEHIQHWVWIKMDGKSRLALSRPFRVMPLSITPLSRVQFVEGGRRRLTVRGVTFARAFAIFLRVGDFERQSERVLALLLRGHTGLLLALTQVDRRGWSEEGRSFLEEFDPKRDLRRDALRSTGWIGVLLYILGRTREVYMRDAGFRLGQLLAAVDVVHIGYCMDERRGQIPMTLLGNAVFATAGSDPQRAFAILQERWRPYAAWAYPRPELLDKIDKGFAEAKQTGDAGRALRESGKVEDGEKLLRQAARTRAPALAMRDALRQVDSIKDLMAQFSGEIERVEVTNTFKAELLFGYMAGLPPADKGTAGGKDDRVTGGENQ